MPAHLQLPDVDARHGGWLQTVGGGGEVVAEGAGGCVVRLSPLLHAPTRDGMVCARHSRTAQCSFMKFGCQPRVRSDFMPGMA